MQKIFDFLGVRIQPGNTDAPAIIIKKRTLNHLRFIDMQSSGNRAERAQPRLNAICPARFVV